jgi:hypothetical protein
LLIANAFYGLFQIPFPLKLHDILSDIEAEGLASVVGWMPDGLCFRIHQPEAFRTIVMPKHLPTQNKIKSFQRQLRLYGFVRISLGPNRGAYFHPDFKKFDRKACLRIHRQKVVRKSSKASATSMESPTPTPKKPIEYTLLKVPSGSQTSSTLAKNYNFDSMMMSSAGEASIGGSFFSSGAGSLSSANRSTIHIAATEPPTSSGNSLLFESPDFLSSLEEMFPSDCSTLFKDISTSNLLECEQGEDGTVTFEGCKFFATDLEPTPI